MILREVLLQLFSLLCPSLQIYGPSWSRCFTLQPSHCV